MLGEHCSTPLVINRIHCEKQRQHSVKAKNKDIEMIVLFLVFPVIDPGNLTMEGWKLVNCKRTLNKNRGDGLKYRVV